MTNVPPRMQAVEISEPGGPEVLQLTERETPYPQDGEVLIENFATSVNRLDVFQREGNYPIPPGVTDIPGLDAAGRVVAVGEGVTDVGIGDDVCALLAGGSYAQYCTAPSGSCLPIPRGMDYIQAAALPETFFTVWSNVFDRGKLRDGETLLVAPAASARRPSRLLPISVRLSSPRPAVPTNVHCAKNSERGRLSITARKISLPPSRSPQTARAWM